MSDIVIELIKWALPSVGAFILAQLPSVKRWANKNWTVSVVTATMIMSFSIMGFGFYTYNKFIKPYVIICETANDCISVKMADFKELKDRSDNTVRELGLIYTDGSAQGHRDFHINQGNRLANETNVVVNRIYTRVIEGHL